MKILTINNLKKKSKLSFFFIFLLVNTALGKERFSFEFLPGGAIIIPSTLFISQEGSPDLKFLARYRSESFNLPIYYSYRLGYKINHNSTIELEMNHLKVKLDNNPPEIEVFSISHGFNQLWVNYALTYKGFVFRGGGGVVIAHPESIVRGKKFDTVMGFANMGYYISGVTSQLALQKKIFLGKHLFLSAETKINAAYAHVNIADGFARVPVFAWNGLIGMGIRF
jgi:hypothetical protein